MTTSTRYPLHLAAAIEKVLSTARGIAHVCPIALSAVLTATSMSFATNAQAAGNTYFVTTSGDPGPGGTLSLRQAIAAANANSGDTVKFASALVGSTITLASGQISIIQPMTIAGPGAGLITISGNNASRIFYIHAYAPVTISDVTLTQGNAGGSPGGAIFAIQTGLVLMHSTISASKGLRGGGVYSISGTLNVEYSRLKGNQAAIAGGALLSKGDAGVRIDSDTVSGNSAGEQGGGMFIEGATYARIRDSTISGNVVPQPDVGSGPQGGGGIAFGGVSGVSYIYNSTITQNYASTGGAGVALLDTQTGNEVEFIFSTVVANTAQLDETGIGITSAGGTVKLYSTIVANNFSQTSADDLAGHFYSNHSLIKNSGGATITGSGSLIGLDPQLGPLVDNGGVTFTMLPATTSPVIGNAPCGCSGTHTRQDQRGFTRHDPNADIGAVEREYPEPLIFRNGFDPL